MNDLYQTVTDRIVAALEAGVPPWMAPWREGASLLPANLATGKPYRGINILMLHGTTLDHGYADNRWLTYRQAAELGAQVRKGESGSPVVFFKWRELPGDEQEDNPRVVPMLRAYTVFNVVQIDGLPDRFRIAEQPAWDPVEKAEDLLAGSGACVHHGGSRAFYVPDQDLIQLPPRSWFGDAPGYYATALHELTHWTGHPSRCNRPLGRKYGLDAYAFEELVAEMGAAFLCSHCGIPAHLEHASYLDSWIAALKGDKRLIFVAAGKAQAAADYVLGLTQSLPAENAALAA